MGQFLGSAFPMGRCALRVQRLAVERSDNVSSCPSLPLSQHFLNGQSRSDANRWSSALSFVLLNFSLPLACYIILNKRGPLPATADSHSVSLPLLCDEMSQPSAASKQVRCTTLFCSTFI
jgi:hypothetical protein